MGYKIKSIDLLVRDIRPPRMDFAIGKGKSLFPEWMRVNVEVRLILESNGGQTAWGCSADWPSFGWLDKRPDIDPKQKLRELLGLVADARNAFLANPEFETAFDGWWAAEEFFFRQPAARSAVPLCGSFAVALIERAMIDAVCRAEGLPFHTMLREGKLGFRPERIHEELAGFEMATCLPTKPSEQVQIRHTVGLNDPLEDSDLDEASRLNDGLPQTLADYVSRDGIRYFKIKVSGDKDANIRRLSRIFEVVRNSDPVFTLDGNEAFDDVDSFHDFVVDFSSRLPEMFERTLFIEQPMSRARTHDTGLSEKMKQIASLKPLIIDEADGYLYAFADAVEIGYSGVSHKNCKGIFKSLANFALCSFRNSDRGSLFQSAEDLTSLPMVALHQDFAVISALGLEHAERNGHHFFFGLSHLSEREKEVATNEHSGLYRQEENELFLNIKNGAVDVASLQSIGLGVVEKPDWESMQTMDAWLSKL